jgi:hypothetical protein
MKIEEMSVYAAGVRDQKYWYRMGSIATIVIGIGYMIIFPLFASVGAPPSGGALRLAKTPSASRKDDSTR